MKFSEQWLREWVNPEFDSAELAHRLTMLGHEVEAVEKQGEGLDRIIIAEVLEARRHPDADRLSICLVSNGDGNPVEVVCGAPNVVAGMKSPFAAPGVQLPNGMKLRRSKIRGVVSNGMLCSAAELGLGDDSDGIIELPSDAPVGQSLVEYLGLPDSVINVDLTPNRGDCFSVLGIARDVAAINGKALEEPTPATIAAAIPDQQPVILEDPTACPRFAGRVIRNISPDACTPLWMVERLRRSGVRGIHPVVDITNYVMLELGQPLHAYDLARVQGTIKPRFARQDEKLVLLDEREVTLNSDTVVVSDDSGPIGMAGIMGGLATAVAPETTDVFFEAAFWPQEIIAGRARSYGMHTDASLRFERGVDPTGQARAINRATELLLQVCGGQAGPLTDEQHPGHLPGRRKINFRHARLNSVLGADIPAATVSAILSGLGLSSLANEAGWTVEVPPFRFDIAIEEDLVEEVARIYGYDRIPETTATAETPLAAVTETQVDLDLVANTLVARDYQEIITYSFIDSESDQLLTGKQSMLVLENPISSEMSVMRGSLLPGMLASVASNASRQQDRIRFFEVGKSFHGTLQSPGEVVRVAAVALGSIRPEQWGERPQGVDFFDVKSDVEALLGLSGKARDFTFVADQHAALQPGQSCTIKLRDTAVGIVGKLHPNIAKKLGVRKDTFVFELDADKVFSAFVVHAQPVSKYPAIRRDIAIVVKETVSAAQIVGAVESAVPAFIENVVIFDIYRGPGIEAGLKSVALGLILQETSRTLTDEDADSAMDAAVNKLQQEFAAVLRD